ncbi:MAG: aminopeptidase P family protein [Planctomycetaceae bacterium]|nr:aminopeptidase P family protein [Planctomycetaceae bacterium]
MIAPHRYPARRDKLKRLLRKSKFPALLVSDETNVRYLTGFTGDSTWLIIGPGIEVLISDGRFTTQLAEECADLTVEIRPVTQTLVQAAGKLLSSLGLSECSFEANALSFQQATTLQDTLVTTALHPTQGLVEGLRAIKDADEVGEIRLAIQQAEKGFSLLKSSLTPEMTELEAAFTLEAGMRRFGALRASFEIIAAVGPRAALPHARPGQARIGDAPFLLVDWGARTTTGYISDLTRMITTGGISPKLQRLYEVVKNAQEQAIASILPGAKASQIDRVARGTIEQAGLGKKFNHGLGHGIGLQVHESIRLGPNSPDVLHAGMVVTVEPGVYLPGWGGIRLEDDVLVTPEGHEILSSWPKELESCGLFC